MARIARRGLRIKALPLFSLDGRPWQSVCDAGGMLPLRLYEPRYVEMARRVLPPAGQGKFGYAETFPPKKGTAGVLAHVEQYRWSSSGQQRTDQDVALLSARAARRFRILSVRAEEVEPKKPPLFVAHVQLLEDRDVARGPGAEGMAYWSQPAGPPGASAAGGVVGADGSAGGAAGAGGALPPPRKRADAVAAGTALVARLGAPVFESPESWQAVAQVPAGVAVVAAGPPRVVEGYLMVPIVPSGAVELTLFRELAADGGDTPVPTEEELRATLLTLSGPAGAARAAGGGAAGPPDALAGRKSRRRRG